MNPCLFDVQTDGDQPVAVDLLGNRKVRAPVYCVWKGVPCSLYEANNSRLNVALPNAYLTDLGELH